MKSSPCWSGSSKTTHFRRLRIDAVVAVAAAAILTLSGCHTLRSKSVDCAAPPPPPAFSQYHLTGFDWSRVNRVLVVPACNQTEFPRAGAEIRQAMAAELQQLGRFEVVSPPPDYPDCLAEFTHVNGRFDEEAMLELCHVFNADVVLHVAVTQYSPYTRPRIGLVVQAVGPQFAKVVASVDGLWDAASPDTACRAREHFRALGPSRLQQYLHGPQTPTDGHADELALESPQLFQRFVCGEVVQNLVYSAGR